MKRIIALILSVAMMLSCYTMSVLALGTNQVSGDSVKADKGDLLVIPVCLKNNSGLMGFRISVDYNETVFKNPSVKRGELTAKGNFNDSIVPKENGSFDVVWNETSDVYGDGALFYIYLTVDDNAKAGNYDIKLSYKQADTFNEKWEDVKLKCSDISVIIENGEKNEDPAASEIKNETIWQKVLSLLNSIYNFIVGLFK